MPERDLQPIREIIRRHALLNAIRFGGKANPQAVAGKAFSEDPTLRTMAPEVFHLADQVVAEVNSMGAGEQKSAAESLGLSTIREKIAQPERLLPPLPHVEKYPVVHVRFAPNPDSVIHLGNTRAAILSDEYAKMYKGLFTLRFEDTSPSIKPPIPEAYEIIRQDLSWLRIHWDDEFIQSDRLPIYYEYASKLISLGGAYVCRCSTESFRAHISKRKSCPCRDLPLEEQLDRWEKMLSGRTRMGRAVVRVKTDLEHPNPAIRDWPAMRIDTKSHPRKGKEFRVWPLYNFASAVDDHLMGITHILRGKEHEVNMYRQIYLYRYFRWSYPEAIHYGRLKIEGTVLSKSKIRQGIEEGIYKDWSDPRLGTIAALRKRGFLPETIRRLILEVGVKPSEAMISWENLESINRKILDPLVKRYVFVRDPLEFRLEGLGKTYMARIPLHPDHHEWGSRNYSVSPERNVILIPSVDATNLDRHPNFRLMNLCNVRSEGQNWGRLISEDVADAKALAAPIIQWLPADLNAPLEVLMPDARSIRGKVDPAVSEQCLPETFQFFRFGFVRVYRDQGKMIGYYTHA